MTDATNTTIASATRSTEGRAAPALPDAPLPDSIRDKLKTEASALTERDVATPAALLAQGRRAVALFRDRFLSHQRLARLPAIPGAPVVAAVRGRVQALLAAKPAWLSLRKVPVSQELRDDLLDRGRRAGMTVGTAIDRVMREVPKRRELPAPASDIDADISTVAVHRAVKQPSIFAPGHILTALLAGGVIHIATTFAITALGTGSAYRQLRSVLPENEMVVLPAQVPGAQVLPYLAADMLYAFCRFDLSRGTVDVSALLPEAGWSLALYTRQGDNFYATPGQSQRPTPVAFVLAPASDRLINLTPGVRKNDVELNQVTSPDTEGLVVVRAPLKGVAFEAATLVDLKRARCAPGQR